MAIKGAVRFKPDVYRSSLETTVAGLNAAATPPTGTVVMRVQLVAYDDTVVTGGNYSPGEPSTEKNLVILYEDTLQMELAAFNGLTQNQATTLWTNALSAWGNSVLPAAPNLVKAIRGARVAPPVVIG